MSQPPIGPQPSPVPPAEIPPPILTQPAAPMQVLAYTMPSNNARPGIITAMGILSIVFGSLQMLANIWGAMAFGIMMAVSSSSWSSLPAVTEFSGPRGYMQMDRRTIVQAFQMKQPLTQPQQDQLDFFLGDVGQLHVPSVSATPSMAGPMADYVSTNLTGESGFNVETGSVWFDLPVGKLTLDDKAAVFAPAKGGPTVQRSVARVLVDQANPDILSTAELQALTDRIQDFISPTTLTAAQIAAIQTQLQTGSFFNSTPKNMSDLLGQITSASSSGNTVTIMFRTGSLQIASTGTVLSSNSWSGTTGVPTFTNMSSTPFVISLVESAASCLLAIYLLVVGILTLRNSRSGARLHRIYAWTKIALVITATITTWWIFTSMMQNVPGGPGGSSVLTGWAWGMSATTLLLGCAYPVAILFVLRSKTSREFFTDIR